MLDIQKYIQRKEKELVSIVKLGSGFVISQKRFDPETGTEVKPEIAGFHIKDLEAIKKELQDRIADVDTLIEDTNNL